MSLLPQVPADVDTAEDAPNDGWDLNTNHMASPADAARLSDGNDSTTAHCLWQTAGGTHESKLRLTLSQLPSSGIGNINSVTYRIRLWRDTSNFQGQEWKPFITIGGTDYDLAAYANADSFDVVQFEFTLTTSPATSNPFTRAELNAALIGVACRNLDTSSVRGIFVSELKLLDDYVGKARYLDVALDVASRRLRRLFAAEPFVHSKVPWHIGLDYAPGDLVHYAHFAAPSETGTGVGEEKWETRLGFIISQRVSPNGYVTRKILPLEELLCAYRDTAWPQSLRPLTGDGVSRIGKGPTRSYARATGAWSQNLASLLYGFFSPDQELFGVDGAIYEGGGTNVIQYSAFQAGDITGWSKVGTGTNGSDINAEAFGSPAAGSGNRMWDPSTGVTQCALLTAGNPHSGDLYIVQTTPSISGVRAVSIWYSNPVDVQYPGYALQRTSDSKFWRASDQTWVSGLLWNPLSAGSVGVVQRHDVLVDFGSATTVLVQLGLPLATTLDDQQARFHCCQIGDSYVFGTPILTTNATGTRDYALYQILDSAERPFLWPDQGALAFTVIPFWSSAAARTASSGPRVVCRVFYDVNNYWALYFDATADTYGAWIWQAVSAGVSYAATYALTAPFEAGDEINLVARWTGTEGELDLDPYTLSILVNGVKGDDAPYVPPAADAATVTIGCFSEDVDHFDGVIRMQTSLQRVPTDIRCQRLP